MVASGQEELRINATLMYPSYHETTLEFFGIYIFIGYDEGSFVLVKTMWLSPLCNLNMGEALGLLHAFHWVHDDELITLILFSI